MTNGYIKGEYEQDYFRIVIESGVYADDERWEAVKTTDCLGSTVSYYLVGDEFYMDGSREKCLEMAMRSAHNYFRNRY